MDAILTRRSIRKYTDQPVSEESVSELLRAAMAAPSAGNQQPWQFVVIRERKTLDQLAVVHPYAAMARTAQVAVAVCGDLSLETNQGYWVQDCAAATENLLIAAEARGLGAVWLGVYPREDRVASIQALLSLPDNVIPLSVVPIGYPAQHPGPADRFDPSRIHLECW
jgi:nitroreductase